MSVYLDANLLSIRVNRACFHNVTAVISDKEVTTFLSAAINSLTNEVQR